MPKDDSDAMESSFRVACKERTQWINTNDEVAGLHQKFPERLQELSDNEGDRLPH